VAYPTHLLQPPPPRSAPWGRASVPATALPSTPALSSTPGAPALRRPELRQLRALRSHAPTLPCSSHAPLSTTVAAASSCASVASHPCAVRGELRGRICLNAGRTPHHRRAPRDAPTPPSPVPTRLGGKSGHRPVLGSLSVAEPEETTFLGSYSLSSPLSAGFPRLRTRSGAILCCLAGGAAKLLLELVQEPYQTAPNSMRLQYKII
jgi:hypothetical protein